jgi:hypothetical protein
MKNTNRCARSAAGTLSVLSIECVLAEEDAGPALEKIIVNAALREFDLQHARISISFEGRISS